MNELCLDNYQEILQYMTLKDLCCFKLLNKTYFHVFKHVKIDTIWTKCITCKCIEKSYLDSFAIINIYEEMIRYIPYPNSKIIPPNVKLLLDFKIIDGKYCLKYPIKFKINDKEFISYQILSSKKINFIYNNDMNNQLYIDEYHLNHKLSRRKPIKNLKKHKGKYILKLVDVDQMQKNTIVMHPLPRVDEISPEVDTSKHAVYFKQAKYGLLIRMALLKRLLSEKTYGTKNHG